MLPNWLYGKSKSKLADILGGGGGGGTTYTAGPGISISSNNRISFRGETAPYDNSASGLEADTVNGAIDELTEKIVTTGTTPLSNSGTDYELLTGFIYRKRGVNILSVSVKCVTPSPISGGNHIKFSELPSGFPHSPAIIYTAIPCYRDGTTNVSAQLQINTNGDLAIRGGEAGAYYSGLFAF
jgi:hypothetical protein